MSIQATPYADVNHLLADLLAQMQAILGSKLVGLYLFGSLVTGDFDRGNSDVDLLAAIASNLTAPEFAALHQMHNAVANAHAFWAGRIETGYLSTHALQTFKTERSPIAIISPGEPFHLKDAGNDWLLNWYVVLRKGVTLFGPPAATLIAPISAAEYRQAVQTQAQDWREWVSHSQDSRPGQGYAILTLCRALYAFEMGEQASKPQAARWAQARLPQWAGLIQNALLWREQWREQNVDPAVTFPDTQRFVHFVIDQMGDATR